jgi:hypothetical protein
MRCGVAVGLRAVFMVPSTSDARETLELREPASKVGPGLGKVAADGVTLSVVVVLVLVPGLGLGVSPLRGAGLSRCASSRRGTGVSPLTGFHP